MSKDHFILISNQRCGSTWLVTSIGNCKNIKTDYEIKWSEELLIGKPSPYHLFLKNQNFDEIFSKLKKKNYESIIGSKFVFDFYKPFPQNYYEEFLNKFVGYKIIHITRDYIDILKSKLIGKVFHILNNKNFKNNRLIDNTIYNKQEEYLKILKKSKTNNDKINFNVASSYLINLFINDLMALSLKSKSQYLNISYREIKNNTKKLSSFLNISFEDLQKNLFDTPTILKNKNKYENNFENYDDLNNLNLKLQNKIKSLQNASFEYQKIISYDAVSKKLEIKI